VVKALLVDAMAVIFKPADDLAGPLIADDREKNEAAAFEPGV